VHDSATVYRRGASQGQGMRLLNRFPGGWVGAFLSAGVVVAIVARAVRRIAIDHLPLDVLFVAASLLEAALVAVAIVALERYRRASRAIHRGAVRYDSVVGALSEGVVIRDAKGKIVEANPAALAILGLTFEQLSRPGERPPGWRLLHEDGSPLTAEFSPGTVTMRTGQPVNRADFILECPGRGRRWVRISTRPIEELGGPPYAVVSAIVDITHRKETEEALRENEQRFRLLAENANDVIARVGPDGRFRYVSPSAAEVFGYTPEELLEQDPFQHFHPDDLPALRASQERLLAEGRATVSYRRRHKDGHWVWIETSIRAQRDAAGEIEELHTVSRDVTARVLAEQGRREAEGMLGTVLEQAPIGVMVCDREGRVILANPAAQRMAGAPPDPGRPVADQVDRYQARRVDGQPIRSEETPMGRALRGETVENEENLFRPPGSSQDVCVRVSAAPLRDEQGEVTAAVMVFSDVTAERESAAALRRAEALLRTVLQQAPNGILVADREGRIILMNQAARAISGMGDREWSRAQRLEAFQARHLDGRPMEPRETALNRALNGEIVVNSENIFRRPGEHEDRYSRLSAAPLRDGEGNITGAVVIYSDVTAERREAEAHRRTEALLESVLEQAPSGVLVCDTEGNIVLMNDAARRISGTPPGQWHTPAERLTAFHTRHLDGRPMRPEETGIGRALRGEVTVDEESLFRPPGDGHDRVVRVSAAPLRDAEGKITGAVMVYSDITAEREASEARRQAEALLGTVLEQAPSGVTVYDREGNLLLANEAAREILGANPGARLPGPDEPTTIAIHSPDGRRLAAGELAVSRALRGEPVFGIEVVIRPPDGSPERHLLTSCAPLRAGGGEVSGAVAIFSDVTAERQEAAARRRAEELLRVVLDEAPVGVMVFDRHAMPLMLNRAARALTGEVTTTYTMEEQARRYDIRTLDGQRVTARNTPVFRALHGEVVPPTTQLFRVPGEEEDTCVRTSAVPLRDAAGQLNGCVVVMADVTMEQKADEARRRAEELLRTVLEQAPVGVMVYDAAGRMVLVNEAGRRISGATPRTDMPVPDQAAAYQLKTLDGRDIAPWDTPVARALAGEDVIDFQYKFQRPGGDGEEHFIRCSCSPLRDGTGQVRGAVAVFSDVTLEVAAADLRQRYAAIVESTEDGVMAAPLDGTLTSWNRGAELLYGFTAEEMIGRNIRAIVPPGREAEVDEILAAAAKGESITGLETQRLHKDGRLIDVSLTISPVRNAEGEVTGVSAIARDITRQKQAELALRAAEARLATILRNLPVGVAVLDMEGRLTYANEASREITGEAPAVGITPQERHAQYDRRDLAGRPIGLEEIPSTRALRGETVLGFEMSYRRPVDGREIWLRTSAAPLHDGEGKQVGAIIVYSDITAQHRAAEELRRLALVVESSTDAIYSRSLDGTITSWNRAAEQLFGYTAEEAIGQPASIIRLPDRAGDDPEVRARIERGEQIPERDTLRRRKDGAIVPVAISIAPLRNALGEVVGASIIARDITERKEAQERLRKSEAALALAQRIASIGSWEWHIESNTVTWSEELYRIYGLEREAFAASFEGFIERVHPDDRERVQAEIQLALEEQRPFAFDHRILRPDGTVRVLAARGTPIFEGQRLAGMSGTGQDVTELRRAEEQFQGLLEASPDAFLAADEAGRIVLANAQAEHLFGYRRDELVGQPIDILVPERYREGHGRHRAGYAESPRPREMGSGLELFARRKDGSEFPVEISLSPFSSGDQRLFLSAIRDITERKEAEAARRAAEQRLEELVNSVDALVWESDEQNGGEVVFMSERADQLFGIEGAHLQRSPEFWLERVHPDDRERVTAARRAAVEALSNHDLEYRIVAADGQVRWVRDYAVVEGENGRPKCVRGVMVDITEAKRLEDAMLQTQKLESLGVLAGGIAHDFNNMLVSILVNAQLAREDLPESSPAHAAVMNVETAVQRAADLANQVLAYSGGARFVVEKLNLNEMVREMVQLLETSVSRSARLEYDLGPGLPAVEGDATQLRQVLMNLVINASDAMGPQGGEIRVSTGVTDADRTFLDSSYFATDLPAGRYVTLEVADTGRGMDAATLSRIFDPFFTTKETGRGLGLAAVLGIIRSHRGAVRVYSEPGKGTTFRLLLPALAEPAVEARPPGHDSEQWSGSGTVLIVDDHAGIREVAAQALGRMGFKTVIASDGLEGLEQFRQRLDEIRCVMLDLTMPGMSGEQAFRAIRELRPDARIVLMSGYNQGERADWVGEDPHATFLRKPFGLAAMREALRDLLKD
jgi:two-component system cell cycle sensor histidine kinase/response regulator CckA